MARVALGTSELCSWRRAARATAAALLCCCCCAASASTDGARLVLYINGPGDDGRFGPDTLYERRAAKALREDIAAQVAHLSGQFQEPLVFDWGDFEPDRSYGAWALWPVLSQLRASASASPHWWLVVLDVDSALRLDRLHKALADLGDDAFYGHVLRDAHASVIHHYAPGVSDWPHRNGVTDTDSMEDKVLAYPESAAGVVMGGALVQRIVDYMGTNEMHGIQFSIDWRYELASLALAATGARLQSAPWLCLRPSPSTTGGPDDASECAVTFVGRRSDTAAGLCHAEPTDPEEALDGDKVVFAVKTYHAYHKDRVVVVKRTWAQDARIVEFFSDVEDLFIPSIVVDTPNTESGHCNKTLEIVRRFLSLDHWANVRWLVIADDDTLISVPRLIELLRCYDHRSPLIIGERYGFGFSADGTAGYDYPTGGAAMILSRAAAVDLSAGCHCPAPNSPDDMIVGACARSTGIPLVHSAALHQARPPDYTGDYLWRQAPISFHKHWEIDPYDVYVKWLQPADKTDSDSGDTLDADGGGASARTEL